ncbi:MAG TPA: response regulator, partial [Gemmatimonadaceae bacterium]|nr:response regulator [Gemmatimonadaceae bacterium]
MAATASTSADEATSADAAPRKPARILIVDDHEDNVELLRARLEARGYETVSARDGRQALEIAAQEPHPDLILLDVMMPHVGGIE